MLAETKRQDAEKDANRDDGEQELRGTRVSLSRITLDTSLGDIISIRNSNDFNNCKDYGGD